MRLRQFALASRNLDAVTDSLATVFGLKVAFRDPHIIHYGLRNAVIEVRLARPMATRSGPIVSLT